MRYNVIAATLTTLILAVLLTGVRSRPDRIQACGKELADLLQNTCLGGYNTYYHSNADGNIPIELNCSFDRLYALEILQKKTLELISVAKN